jgi:hypothetical protein
MNIFHCFDWLLSQNFQLIADVTNGSSVELELVEKYIKFLDSANTGSAKSFNDSISHLETFMLIFISAIVAILGGSLWTSKDNALKILDGQLEKIIAQKVDDRTDVLKTLIEKEGVIGKTNIHYLLIGDYQKPTECQLFIDRQFKEVEFFTNIQDCKNSLNDLSNKNEYNVIVIDFLNQEFVSEEKNLKKLSEEQKRIIQQGREEIINLIIKIINKSSLKLVLVIYVPSPPRQGLHPPIFQLLDENEIYYTPANNPVSLIGRVVDAAQMAYALQHRKNP